jgi:hypothetical protein
VTQSSDALRYPGSLTDGDATGDAPRDDGEALRCWSGTPPLRGG